MRLGTDRLGDVGDRRGRCGGAVVPARSEDADDTTDDAADDAENTAEEPGMRRRRGTGTDDDRAERGHSGGLSDKRLPNGASCRETKPRRVASAKAQIGWASPAWSARAVIGVDTWPMRNVLFLGFGTVATVSRPFAPSHTAWPGLGAGLEWRRRAPRTPSASIAGLSGWR